LQGALAKLQLPPARLVSYSDLIAGKVDLRDLLTPTSLLRIESPGKSVESEHALLSLGANCEEPEACSYERIGQAALAAQPFEKGLILPSRQWYLGYCRILELIQQQAGQTMNHPAAIMTMFDKRACHALLESHALAVPPAIGPISCYDELLVQMRQRNWRQVFVKLAHGSSASGVVAFRMHKEQYQAITTVEMVRHQGQVRLYNTRRIQIYRNEGEIATLIDALCRHRVHVEQWLPRAFSGTRIFDLRLVVIAGQVQHVVVRQSAMPITNLHLLNPRGDLEAVMQAVGPGRWQAALETCQRAAALFPSLYMGIDLLFKPGFKQHAIIEMNAFGDLLPGVLYEGRDTYSSEILAALATSQVGAS